MNCCLCDVLKQVVSHRKNQAKTTGSFQVRPVRSVVIFAALVTALCCQAQRSGDQKVVLVLLDGIRWQDVFRGADPELLNEEAGGIEDVESIKKAYWSESIEERRRKLMPFLWETIVKEGQLYGNRDSGSAMRVENKFHFSYPGYSEMITGIADDRINTNNPIPNPNPSVFEYLNGRPGYKGHVAIFSVWKIVPAMVNRDKTKLPVNAAMERMQFGTKSPVYDAIDGIRRNGFHLYAEDPADAFAFYTAMEYFRLDKPRAVWLTFGETDSYAHEGRYDRYLDAMHRNDAMLRELWTMLQSSREYKGKTTLIVSVDHGRGLAPSAWRDHGANVPGAHESWLAIVGPRTPALGVRTNIPEVTTAQIAATVAVAVGEDFAATNARIAKPIAGAIQGRSAERVR
jgi:hypothetical protein